MSTNYITQEKFYPGHRYPVTLGRKCMPPRPLLALERWPVSFFLFVYAPHAAACTGFAARFFLLFMAPGPPLPGHYQALPVHCKGIIKQYRALQGHYQGISRALPRHNQGIWMDKRNCKLFCNNVIPKIKKQDKEIKCVL